LLLKFDKPTPASLLSDAAALSQSIELELAYECAPDEEFGFGDLAKDYFSNNASTVEQVASLLRLHEAPHYFRRGGSKGRFKKAPAEIVQQALLAIEK
jgi:exoribonuclease-2